MKNLNKYLALLMVLVFATFEVNSQTESVTIKTTGQMRIFNTGKLKINSDSGRVRTATTTNSIDNLGEIQFNGINNTFTAVTDDNCDDFQNDNEALAYGASASSRVPGLVVYSAISGTQNIQDRYYTDLTMAENGSKVIPDSVFVSGAYLASGGDRTYNGTFFYDGTLAQTILGETAGPSSGYNDVVFQGAGSKTLDTTATAAMNSLIIDPATGNVVINGTLNIANNITQASDNNLSIPGGSVTISDGTSVLAGTVDLSGTNGDVGTLSVNGGLLNISGTTTLGDFSLLDISSANGLIDTNGTLTIGNFADAKLNLGALDTLTVTGTMTNGRAAGDKDNVTFADNSLVIYNGIDGQVIMATDTSNAYGNLAVNGKGAKTASGQVALSGNFSLADTNLTMGINCDANTLLYMTDATASSSFGGDALSEYEVIGRFRRNIGGINTPLTFNNFKTTVEIENASKLNYVELCVLPGDTSMTDYNIATDVKRSIKYFYDTVATTGDWAADIQFGYRSSELESINRTNAFKSSLRFREDDGAEADKVSTGVQPVRDTTTNPFNSVLLAQIRGTGGRVAPQNELAEVDNGNMLYLRGGPATFISIEDGRWSNPGTWDEGEQPGPLDVVKIRTNVHIGFQRDGIDGLTTAGQINENIAIAQKGNGTYTNRNTIAARIEINDGFGTSNNSNTASLIVGGDGQNTLAEMVGITRLADNDPLANLIGTTGTIIIKQGSNLFTETEFDTFEAAGPNGVEESSTSYNAGLVVRTGAEFLARNSICVEGAINLGGEINTAEED